MTNNKLDQSPRTAIGHKQESLDAARMAEFVFSAKSNEAIRFVEYLSELTFQHEANKKTRKRARQGHAAKSFRDAVAAFGADLLQHSGNEASEGFMYRSSDKDALGLTLVSVRSFEQLVEFWEDMGLMEVTSFFRAKETWEEHEIGAYLGRTRRYRARDELIKCAEGFGLNPSNIKEHFEKQMGRLSPVLVRGERPSLNGKKGLSTTIKVKGPKFDFEARRI